MRKKKQLKLTQDKNQRPFWIPTYMNTFTSDFRTGVNQESEDKLSHLLIFSGNLNTDKSMNRLIEETLKNPKTGQWSRKNLTSFFAFAFACTYSLLGLILGKEVHDFVVIGFLSLTASLLGISTWEKKNL